MSALFFRPVATYPVRCSTPVVFQKPSYPSPHDIAPLFSIFNESYAQLEKAHQQTRQHFKRPFNPKFDVKETDNSYSVEGELPGFDAKDISIEFLDDGHTLQIKGKTIKDIRQPRSTQAVQAARSEAPKAVEQATGTTPAAEQRSDTSSVRSHQATVEDDVENPVDASGAIERPKTQQEQVTPESSSKPAREQVEQQAPEQDTKHLISERLTGSFSRSFQFPSKVDQEAVKASLRDGILAITLPFARKPESRRIQIE